MFRRVAGLSVVLLAFLVGSPRTAGAATIFFDDFESDSLALNASLVNWNVSNGTIDVVGIGFFDGLCNPASGSSPSPAHCIDMDGSTGDAGKITTKSSFLFNPGTYGFDFYAAGNQRGGPADTTNFQIGAGTLFNATLTLASSSPWTHYAGAFVVASPTVASLSIEGLGGDNIGMLIDNVRITGDVGITAVPEPASLGLLGCGLAALAARQRRRSRS